MPHKLSSLLPVAILFSACTMPCSASLVGTHVTGSLTFAGDPSNYFDPGYGFVPVGHLNGTGNSVTVSNPAVEFGFDDGSSLISADFSNTQLALTDLIELSGPANSFQLVITDAALSAQTLTLLSDNFPIAEYSLAGDVLTIGYAGGTPTAGQTFTATFGAATTPEPSGFSLMATAMLAGIPLLVARKRRHA